MLHVYVRTLRLHDRIGIKEKLNNYRLQGVFGGGGVPRRVKISGLGNTRIQPRFREFLKLLSRCELTTWEKRFANCNAVLTINQLIHDLRYYIIRVTLSFFFFILMEHSSTVKKIIETNTRALKTLAYLVVVKCKNMTRKQG